MHKLACTFMERLYEFMLNGIHFTETKPQYAHDTIRCMCNNYVGVYDMLLQGGWPLRVAHDTDTQYMHTFNAQRRTRALAHACIFICHSQSDDAQIEILHFNIFPTTILLSRAAVRSGGADGFVVVLVMVLFGARRADEMEWQSALACVMQMMRVHACIILEGVAITAAAAPCGGILFFFNIPIQNISCEHNREPRLRPPIKRS